MSELPGDLQYTSDHEWLRREDDGNVTVGITDHAQSALGDLVYVELPEVNQEVEAGGDMAVVESVKAASDVYAPIGGTVVAVNEALTDDPEAINNDPYGDGWIVRLEPGGDEGELLTPDAYHTDDDTREMLEAIGAESIDELFDEIPAALIIDSLDGVPEAMSEMEITRLMRERAAMDGAPLCFIGAGAYEHHIPQAVWDIATRGEYYSAYTPYQAEASQGTLQTIYEYQSMITELTGLDVSNASLYDGASGLAEAALMAVRSNRKAKSRQVLLAPGVRREPGPHVRLPADGHVDRQSRFRCSRRQRRTGRGRRSAANLPRHAGGRRSNHGLGACARRVRHCDAATGSRSACRCRPVAPISAS
jgi:glycine cleavage system H protein